MLDSSPNQKQSAPGAPSPLADAADLEAAVEHPVVAVEHLEAVAGADLLLAVDVVVSPLVVVHEVAPADSLPEADLVVDSRPVEGVVDLTKGSNRLPEEFGRRCVRGQKIVRLSFHAVSFL